MNIQPISANNTNFNGLWKLGKVKQYYPFMDETKTQITKAVKEKSDVSVMEKLPFTANQFLQYTKNRLNITRERLVERYYRGKGLSIAG
jgi:hypothetical protein